MNTHHPIVPTTTITLPNVYVLRTQAMNPNIGHMTMHVNCQTTWSQLITPIVQSKTNMLLTSRYPMWYNVITPFVPLDPSLYPTYLTRTKGLDYLIFRNYTCYVLGNVYRIPQQPVIPPTYIPYSVGNQFPTLVQLVTNNNRQHVQQPITTNAPPSSLMDSIANPKVKTMEEGIGGVPWLATLLG
jgi:hypothetical protein